MIWKFFFNAECSLSFFVFNFVGENERKNANTKRCIKLLTTPGPSTTPGRFGRNDESCSFTFLPLNLLYECCSP